MQQSKGLTLRDYNHINSTCRAIAKCDKYGVEVQELRQQVYMLGLFTFRQFHKAGFPTNYKNPSLLNKGKTINEHASTS